MVSEGGQEINLNTDVRLLEAAVIASLHGFALLGTSLTLC